MGDFILGGHHVTSVQANGDHVVEWTELVVPNRLRKMGTSVPEEAPGHVTGSTDRTLFRGDGGLLPSNSEGARRRGDRHGQAGPPQQAAGTPSEYVSFGVRRQCGGRAGGREPEKRVREAAVSRAGKANSPGKHRRIF